MADAEFRRAAPVPDELIPERLLGVGVPQPPHPVWASFTCWRGTAAPGWDVNVLGVKTRVAFFSMYEELADFSSARELVTAPPIQNDEYFEWVDLLESVVAAEGCFRMIELGAGWGRWLACGALAAKQRGLPFALVGVEADPQHFEWMKRHFEDNGIDERSTTVIQAAVAAEEGKVWFHTGDSANWYGQRIADGPPAATRRHLRELLARRRGARRV